MVDVFFLILTDSFDVFRHSECKKERNAANKKKWLLNLPRIELTAFEFYFSSIHTPAPSVQDLGITRNSYSILFNIHLYMIWHLINFFEVLAYYCSINRFVKPILSGSFVSRRQVYVQWHEFIQF